MFMGKVHGYFLGCFTGLSIIRVAQALRVKRCTKNQCVGVESSFLMWIFATREEH